jgi:hypothetical protein
MMGTAAWVEEQHPRDSNGRFGAGDGSALGKWSESKDKPAVKGWREQLLANVQTGETNLAGSPQFAKTGKGELAAVIDGVHDEGLEKWLDRPENVPHLTITTNGDGELPPGVEGSYNNGKIVLDSTAHPAATDSDNDDYAAPRGKNEKWGDQWGVSDKIVDPAADPLRSSLKRVQSNFLHELGHHVALLDHSTSVDEIISRAYSSHGFDDPRPTEAVGKMTPLKQHILSRVNDYENIENPAISRYAVTNKHEYFAESFAAYMDWGSGDVFIADGFRRALKQKDPTGYKMVEDVLKVRGIR